jgi:hypothetical protein
MRAGGPTRTYTRADDADAGETRNKELKMTAPAVRNVHRHIDDLPIFRSY